MRDVCVRAWLCWRACTMCVQFVWCSRVGRGVVRRRAAWRGVVKWGGVGGHLWAASKTCKKTKTISIRTHVRVWDMNGRTAMENGRLRVPCLGACALILKPSVFFSFSGMLWWSCVGVARDFSRFVDVPAGMHQLLV